MHLIHFSASYVSFPEWSTIASWWSRHPFEEYDRQIESFPQVNKRKQKPPPSYGNPTIGDVYGDYIEPLQGSLGGLKIPYTKSQIQWDLPNSFSWIPWLLQVIGRLLRHVALTLNFIQASAGSSRRWWEKSRKTEPRVRRCLGGPHWNTDPHQRYVGRL